MSYTCARCGGPSGMYGHYQPLSKTFTCEKKDKTVLKKQESPLVARTEGERQAYHDGYIAGLDLAIKKGKGRRMDGDYVARELEEFRAAAIHVHKGMNGA